MLHCLLKSNTQMQKSIKKLCFIMSKINNFAYLYIIKIWIIHKIFLDRKDWKLQLKDQGVVRNPEILLTANAGSLLSRQEHLWLFERRRQCKLRRKPMTLKHAPVLL